MRNFLKVTLTELKALMHREALRKKGTRIIPEFPCNETYTTNHYAKGLNSCIDTCNHTQSSWF
jgi:hypothetical protein